MAEKMLTSEEKAAAMPVVQSAMQAYQQHYGIKLTEQETSRVVENALKNLRSTSTSEVRGAIKDQLFALLMKKDPARAIELRMQTQGVAEPEKSRIHDIAEEKGFKAANAELAKLTKTPAEKPLEAAPAVAAKAGSPKEARAQTPAQSPMFLDSTHDPEINRTLGDAAKAYFGKPFEELKPLEKAELLLRAMRAPEFFNFQYNIVSEGPPRNVEDVYRARNGDCDELSRFYAVIASKPEFGLTNLTQFYVMFRNPATGNEIAHTAIFYVGGNVVFIDPAKGDFKAYPKQFKSPEDVMRDREFRKFLLNFATQVTGDKGPLVIAEIAVFSGGLKSMDASYYFNYGKYYADEENWQKAAESFLTALEKGAKTYSVYYQIGQAYYHLGNYKKALEFYKEALKIEKNPNVYECLGTVYLQLGDYKNAIASFREQLNIDHNSVSARVGFGATYLQLGGNQYDAEEYAKALVYYKLAGRYLSTALKLNQGELTEDLSLNLSAFYASMFAVLKTAGNTKAIQELKADYEKLRPTGFENEEMDELFKSY